MGRGGPGIVALLIAAAAMGCAEEKQTADVSAIMSSLCGDLTADEWLPSFDVPSNEELQRFRDQAEELAEAGEDEKADRLNGALDEVEAALDDLKVSIFLKRDFSDEDRREIEETLEAHGASDWRFQSSAEALQEFKQIFEGRPELWENLDDDSLPASYLANMPSDVEQELTKALEQLPASDEVRTSGIPLEQARLEVAVYEVCDQPVPPALQEYLKQAANGPFTLTPSPDPS